MRQEQTDEIHIESMVTVYVESLQGPILSVIEVFECLPLLLCQPEVFWMLKL